LFSPNLVKFPTPNNLFFNKSETVVSARKKT